MRIDFVTRREEIASIREQWDALALADTRDGFCRTSGWYSAWMNHIRPDAEPFIVVVRDSGGGIVGLAPFCRAQFSDLGFRLTTVSFGGREVVSGDFLDFLTAPYDKARIVKTILEALWEASSKWGLFTAGELIDGEMSDSAVTAFAENHRCQVRRQEERICPYIELPGSFDEYLNTLGSSTRYHIRRRIRDVIDKRGARVDVYSQPEEVTSRLDTFIRLHQARWRRDDQPGTLTRKGFAPFLQEVCGAPPAGSRCRLYVLSDGDSPAAALLTFHFGESALYYQAGWDPDSPLAQLSPGVVVMAHSIRDAIQDGLRYYEFLRGDEEYKSRWTKTYRKTVTVLIARSVMASQYLRVAQMKDSVKQRFPAMWNRVANPVAIPASQAGAAAAGDQS